MDVLLIALPDKAHAQTLGHQLCAKLHIAYYPDAARLDLVIFQNLLFHPPGALHLGVQKYRLTAQKVRVKEVEL